MVKDVGWPARAQKQFIKAYEYTLKASCQNAEKVKEGILASTCNWHVDRQIIYGY